MGLQEMIGEPIVYFVRHGETDLNAGNKFRGFIDVDLDANGVRQAKEAAEYLKDVPFKAAFVSDLTRTRQTAKTVLGKRDIVPEIVSAGRPWNVGKFTGKPKTEAARQELQLYADSPETTIPDGESLNQYRSRFGNLFRDVQTKALDVGGPVLLVGHASNGHELGNIIYGDIDALDVDPGGIIAVYMTRSGLEGRRLKNPAQEVGYGQS